MQTWCHVARVFLYRKENLKNEGTVWLWPEMCFFVSYYMFWFLYGRALVATGLRVWKTYNLTAWHEKYSQFSLPAVTALFLVSCYTYGDHHLNSPYFMEVQEPSMKYFELDHYAWGRLGDMIMFTYHVLMAVYIGSQV